MQRGPFKIAVRVKSFRSPAVLPRGGFDLAQHGVEGNRLAVIGAVIFAKFLHAENFTPSRKEANKLSARTIYFFARSRPANNVSRLFKLASDFAGNFGFSISRRKSIPSSMVRTDLGRMAPAAFAWPPPWNFSAICSRSEERRV